MRSIQGAMWNLPAPPGFQGFDPIKPLNVYYRHLPHWRQDGASYFVTFRLHDSLPQEKLHELKALREEWQARLERHEQRDDSAIRPMEEMLAREIQRLVEKWLDQGMGCCVLRQAWASRVVADSLHYLDGQKYELGCFVVMPNHVHAVIRPLFPGTLPLERILQSRKRYTATEINNRLRRSGSFWQEEAFDRIIRDEEHLYRVIQYIGKNPTNARLRDGHFVRWIKPQWEELGWRFDRV